MPAYTLELDVDDAAMKAAVSELGKRGMNAAMRRAVLKTARIARKTLAGATRAAMHDEPGGYDPYSPRNFRTPRARTEVGGVSAGTGFTQAGSFDRFRSSGTAPRYRHFSHGRGYTGVEIGLGMIQTAKAASDPVYPAIADAELQAEIAKLDLA